MPTNSKLYIGAMSGTSHDAVDVSLISVNKKNIKLEAFDSIKIPRNLSDDIRNTISNNLISLSDLGVLNKKVGLNGFFEDRIINSEMALFSDAGLFQQGEDMKGLASFGIGIRFSGMFYNKPIYLRLDFPFILIDGKETSYEKNLVLSFHRSI